jgi:hypothetical protein
MRNAVPPPITDEVLDEETGRGLLMRVKPGGVASRSSAEVVLGETQVSVRAKRSQTMLLETGKSSVDIIGKIR